MSTLPEFRHITPVTVRFHEVDMLGVCNNAVYVSYFEHARLQYIKDIGLMPPDGIFTDGFVYFMVRNEVNYKGHAFYDEDLDIYTRISYIKNSSYGFEHIITRRKTGETIVDGKGVVARVDPDTKKSTPLSDEFIKIVTSYEKDVQILRK